jgi:hypothetical protein
LQHVKEDVLLLLHNQPQLFQIHVIAKQQQLENAEVQELLFKPHVEITKSLHVDKDVLHLKQSTHVIVKKQQLQNVEVQELLFKPHVEITKLQHVKEDVLLHHHHQPQLFQIHVIVTHLQLQNVEQQELPFKQNAEIKLT